VWPKSLWQLSSVAWGSAPAHKVRRAIAGHAENGYTAFGRPLSPCSSPLLPRDVLYLNFRQTWCVQVTDPIRPLLLTSSREYIIVATRVSWIRGFGCLQAHCNQLPKTHFPSADDNFSLSGAGSVPILADHYGSAEIMFVSEASALPPRLKLFGLTFGVTSVVPSPPLVLLLLCLCFVIGRVELSKTSNLRSKSSGQPNGAYFDRRRSPGQSWKRLYVRGWIACSRTVWTFYRCVVCDPHAPTHPLHGCSVDGGGAAMHTFRSSTDRMYRFRTHTPPQKKQPHTVPLERLFRLRLHHRTSPPSRPPKGRSNFGARAV
jgi:hypothetical protein